MSMELGGDHGVGLENAGWEQIEEAMTATELLPVPPTSDPERLLRYVLQIQPKYTEMEMLTTHLRLYATSLEQDLEQARNHSRILSSEVASEREKKQFLERYAAQIVKERNELLHTRSSKKTKSTASGHFTWHSCCKKSGEHSADLMPSMAAFRGEKLQEAVNLMRSLQDEVRNQERLRQEVNFMLKRTHREHDSKSASDRKHIQQLEKQLVQRAMLHSTLERKLYELESALARYDSVKLQEIGAVEKELEETHGRVSMLETQCARYQVTQGDLEAERDDLQERLTHVMVLKDELADQVDRLATELAQSQAEVEALRGEVEVLQSEDVTSIKNMYDVKMKKLQDEWSEREHELMNQVDVLRHELRTNEALLQRVTLHVKDEEADEHESEIGSRSHNSWTRQRNEWLQGSTMQEDVDEHQHVGSSLSRSQLSHSAFSNHSVDDLIAMELGTELDEATSKSIRDRLRSLSQEADEYASEHLASEPLEYPSYVQPVKPAEESFCRGSRSSRTTKRDDSEMSSPAMRRTTKTSKPSRDPISEIFETKTTSNADTSGKLLADMHEMLKKFQDRRIEEERKAHEAELALETYRQDRDDFQNMLAPLA